MRRYWTCHTAATTLAREGWLCEVQCVTCALLFQRSISRTCPRFSAGEGDSCTSCESPKDEPMKVTPSVMCEILDACDVMPIRSSISPSTCAPQEWARVTVASGAGTSANGVGVRFDVGWGRIEGCKAPFHCLMRQA